jgi:hypothetical protein
MQDRADAGHDDRRTPGMTASRLLVALLRSDDPAVQAVLTTATDREVLLTRVEAEARQTTA